ncbi:chorismate-binding protein [Rhodobacteraceae bacterium D3-12]|nr:chorismate-binding protein [Rhodobacteraceae bacterium D3-12]
MKLTAAQTASLCFAAANDLAYAFWRQPGEAGFTTLISCTPPQTTAVFGGADLPGFVAAPFRTEDGNQASHFPADVLITPTQTRFRNGTGFAETPQSDLQAAIARGTTRRPLQAPASATAPAPTPRAAYEARVKRAVATIKSGACEKIVLSRIDPRPLPDAYDLIALSEALAREHAHAMITVFSAPDTSTWLVATPEILLTADAQGVETMALAGTQWPPSGTPLSDVNWDDKIVHEQALVADFIREAFTAEGVTNLRETAAATVQAANLCHLRSEFTAAALPAETLAGLLRRLHPTSAVCGMPRPESRAFILDEEGDTRGLYTGYFGPTALDGRTALYVNLRSARVAGSEIYLHVGGGIVAASDPALEWEETVAKTKTIGCVLEPA